MNILSGLNPSSIWSYFEEICSIPRPSKKEEKIVAYLIQFAESHNLEVKKDAIGNVLILKPATTGMEHKKTIALQSHVDMVCEKNSATNHNFLTDPIQPIIDGEWVKAKGTTLGADDGIGVAAELALLAANDVAHGPIECLFTVDEETGLSGAFALEKDFLKAEILLNLDSEDEGELYIGCAGGVDTLVDYTYSKQTPPLGYIALKVAVRGLKGGHSGGDIHLGLGNANKILSTFLKMCSKKTELYIADFNGGNLRNAIAREAHAIVLIPSSFKEQIRVDLNIYIADIESDFKGIEPDIAMDLETITQPSFVLDNQSSLNLIQMIDQCPHGVIAMSKDIPDLVETSTNLASVKFTDANTIRFTTSQRSSVESSKQILAKQIVAVFTPFNTKITHSDGYPGWAPNLNSPILDIAQHSYQSLFSVKPAVLAVHAGLECGLFLEKYPNLDMVSFGPSIYGAHSPDERLNITTVQKFWDLLIDILKNGPSV